MPGRLSDVNKRSGKHRLGENERCDEETEDLDQSTLQAKIEYLSAVDLFQDLTPEEIEEIDRVTVMRSCKAGRVFYSPGETGEVLFILKKGAVEIYRKSPRGRKLVITELHPYSFFGEMSCIGQGMHQRYARATEDSLVCTMNRADVERLLLSKPKVALRILEAVGKRMIDVEQRLEEFAFKQIASRIASFLLREVDGNEVKGLRHQDIAERLGVFRETVTDALDQLKIAGIIDIERKRITILDRKRLEQKAAQ